MTVLCEICDKTSLRCRCVPSDSHITIDRKDLLELIFFARRYCDNRSTYAPRSFNDIYERIRENHPDIVNHDFPDETLMEKGLYWPFAQDGMYDPSKKLFDARPF